MSVKRQATTELNHDNWNQDDPEEHEEMGMFKTASKDVLAKRVIRTAKRRTQPGDEAKKSVFSGFGGFNKTQPSTFDFLANLTNGNKATNGKSETPMSSGLFSSKPTASNPGSGLFSTPVTSSPASNPTFGKSTASSSLFGGSAATTTTSPFGSSKPENAASSPFMKQPSANSESKDVFKSTSNSAFGTSSITTKKLSFSTNNNSNSLPFQVTTNTFGVSKTTSEKEPEKQTEDKIDDKKMNYYAKLKGLNESVSDWIKKHVEETPLCILTPIFKDYEKHLKEIQEEYQGTEKESNKPSENVSETKPAETSFGTKTSDTKTNSGSSDFINSKPSIFGYNSSNPSEKPAAAGFSFGIKTTSNSPAPSAGLSFGVNTTSSSNTTSGGFSFGVNSAPQTTTATSSSLFSVAPNAGSNGPTPFSFSGGNSFSFSSNVSQKPAESGTEDKDDEDQPPKVEYNPLVEENSVFEKKCKIFVKKDGNFADKGVGTLYIKKVEESGKHQLLVRANTSLGNVLLNLILSSSIPTQRLGKNNVMLACIPTPEAKPPPTPVLIRVKTSEEADELLETLDKYKT